MAHGNVRRGQQTRVQFPGVTIHFQLFAGVHGQDHQRGIGGVPFTVTAGGTQIQSGSTATDGSIAIQLPATTTECTLRIFGIDYTVRVSTPEPLTPPLASMNGMTFGDQDTAFPKIKERLYRLGYHKGFPAADAWDLDAELDKALLDFQVNERLTPRADGVAGPQTLECLRERAP